jgi:hypothetical protein
LPVALLLATLSACDSILPPPEERVTRVDIYSDYIEYRLSRYTTPSALAIGLAANRDEPRIIELHDCERRPVLEGVLDVVRQRGNYNFSVILPDDC